MTPTYLRGTAELFDETDGGGFRPCKRLLGLTNETHIYCRLCAAAVGPCLGRNCTSRDDPANARLGKRVRRRKRRWFIAVGRRQRPCRRFHRDMEWGRYPVLLRRPGPLLQPWFDVHE